MLNAASSLLEELSPKLALTLNPLNTSARITLASALLSETNGSDEAAALIRRGLALDRNDARFHSLAGIFLEKKGDTAGAVKSFDNALLLQPVEIQALSRRFLFEISSGQFDASARSAELIARRWAVHWPLVEPHLPAIVSDPVRLEKVAKQFSATPGLRSALVTSLMKSPAGLPLAFSVLQQWAQTPFEDTPRFINSLTRAYLAAGNYSGAFLAFRLSVPQQEVFGHIYNGNFLRPPNGNAFDWNLKSPAGMNIGIVRTPAAAIPKLEAAKVPISGNSLELRFLDAPVRFNGADTLVRVAPGNYRIVLVYSTNALRAPNPVRLGVSCFRTNAKLAELELATGDNDPKTLEGQFTIAPAGCPLQKIHFFNQSLTDSWKDRFSGSVLIHEALIVKLEDGSPL